MQNATTTTQDRFLPTPHQAEVIARTIEHGLIYVRLYARLALSGAPTDRLLAIEEIADDLHNAPGLLTGAHPKQWGAELYEQIVRLDPFKGADMTAVFEEVNRRNAQAARAPIEVSEKAVADRLRRKLAKEGLRLRKAGRRDIELGPYYAVNENNVVERTNIKPQHYDCVRPHEVVTYA